MTGPTEAEKLLIHHLSGDLGDSAAPYAELAAKCGLTEAQVLAAVSRFQAQGLIRRFGATLWHQRSGFAANAMVVFRVKEDQAARVGEELAARPYVSHCYQRKTAPGWSFNLYAMIHAESQDQLSAMVGEMAQISGAEEWRVLESLKELKKASLRYFAETSVP